MGAFQELIRKKLGLRKDRWPTCDEKAKVPKPTRSSLSDKTQIDVGIAEGPNARKTTAQGPKAVTQATAWTNRS